MVVVGLLYPHVKKGLEELLLDVLQVIAYIYIKVKRWLWKH